MSCVSSPPSVQYVCVMICDTNIYYTSYTGRQACLSLLDVKAEDKEQRSEPWALRGGPLALLLGRHNLCVFSIIIYDFLLLHVIQDLGRYEAMQLTLHAWTFPSRDDQQHWSLPWCQEPQAIVMARNWY